MPDQDRGFAFLHTWNRDQEIGVRCPSCPGYRVTYQADCVSCGRKLAYQDSEPNDSVITCKLEPVQPAILPRISATSYTHAAPAPSQNQASKRPRTSKARRQSLDPISVRNVSRLRRPSVGRESGHPGPSRFLLPATAPGSRSYSVRRWQQTTFNEPADIRKSLTSSSRRTSTGAYLSASRGSSRPPVRRVGAHQDYKGVRTRRGVRGFLVEIRPPKWKKTIWLGTYNTAVEAAGAFDAGVFYTNKPNTKYNFQALEAAFPPLPSHLSLVRPDNMEEIKYFVQKQAKLAAAAARRMLSSHVTNITIASSGVTQPHHQELLQPELKPAKIVQALTTAKVEDVNSSSTESESCLTVGSVSAGNVETHLPSPGAEYDGCGFLAEVPMDFDYIRGSLPAVDEDTAENWIAEYTNYLNTQPAQGPVS